MLDGRRTLSDGLLASKAHSRAQLKPMNFPHGTLQTYPCAQPATSGLHHSSHENNAATHSASEVKTIAPEVQDFFVHTGGAK